MYFTSVGTCRGIVIKVGVNTLCGNITRIASTMKQKQTALSKEITNLVLWLTCIGLACALIFWVTAMSYGLDWPDASIYFVATCVAMVPESLLSAVNVSGNVKL